jgi:hypothetical protein
MLVSVEAVILHVSGVQVVGHVLDVGAGVACGASVFFLRILLGNHREKLVLDSLVELEARGLVVYDDVGLRVEEVDLGLAHLKDVQHLGFVHLEHQVGLVVHEVELPHHVLLVKIQNVETSESLQIFENYVLFVKVDRLALDLMIEIDYDRADNVLKPQADGIVLHGFLPALVAQKGLIQQLHSIR